MRLSIVIASAAFVLAACKSGDAKTCADRDLADGVRYAACWKVCDASTNTDKDACDSMTTLEWSACTKDKVARACQHNCHMNGFPSEGCEQLAALCKEGNQEACRLDAEERAMLKK